MGLSFTPVVLSAGRISLQVSTEVSELTNTGAFTVNTTSSTDSSGETTTVSGLTIPALSVRRAETTVEVPSGGSFAIAGLMQHTTKQDIDAFPGLKDMPILGALFRSRDFQNNETELVVIISAYLVNPTAEAKLAAPTDGYSTPSDESTILMGRLNETNTKPTPDAAKPILRPPSASSWSRGTPCRSEQKTSCVWLLSSPFLRREAARRRSTTRTALVEDPMTNHPDHGRAELSHAEAVLLGAECRTDAGTIAEVRRVRRRLHRTRQRRDLHLGALGT